MQVHRGSEAGDLSSAFEARAFTHAGEVYLPASHGPLSGPKAQSLLAHELTHVSQQRRLGSSLPSEETPEGRQLEAQAAAAESSRQLPLAVRSDHDQAQLATGASSHGATNTANAANTASTGSASDTLSMQLAPIDGGGVQRAQQAQFTDPDDAFKDRLDHFESYLYGRLERRLRRQLLSERERGGTLIDAL